MHRNLNTPALAIATLSLALLIGRGGPASASDVVVHDYAGGSGLGLAGKLVVPAEPGTYPLAVVSHGWSSSATYFVGWGKIIASLGFVVVVPSFPNPLMPDMAENANIIERLVEHFRNPPADSPAFGMVDPQALALVGHSGGGNSTAAAAVNLKPAATVLFDPVDTSGLMAGKMDELCGPVLTIFADPGSCNSQNGWEPRVDQTTGPRYAFHVLGATHCDGEKPARAACGPFCGGAATAKAQAEFQRYLEAMLRAYVLSDENALALLDEAVLTGNPMLGSFNCDADQPSCVPLPWDEDVDTGTENDSGTTSDEPIDTDSVDTATQTADIETDNSAVSTDEPIATQNEDTGDAVDTQSSSQPPPTQTLLGNADSSCFAAHPGQIRAYSLLAALLSALF